MSIRGAADELLLIPEKCKHVPWKQAHVCKHHVSI